MRKKEMILLRLVSVVFVNEVKQSIDLKIASFLAMTNFLR